MADESSGQEKTEEPTSRRLQEARDKGDVSKSIEVPSAAVLLASLMALYLSRDVIMRILMQFTAHYLANADTIELLPGTMFSLTREGMIAMAMVSGPVLVAVFLTALVANYAQVGVIFTTEKIMPDFTKIDPIAGFGRKFSMQSLADLIKSLLKIGLIGYVAFSEAYKALPDFMPLMDKEPYQIMAFAGRTAFWIFLKCALVVTILAAIDYSFQRWQFMKKMKMTKQELKEEAKMTEGDPQVKGRIRSLQMQMARQRMMSEVPKADVVITNPTRLAIALRYESASMAAPQVVAKGAGVIAQRIREIAAENSVPLVENKPLAQALYKAVALNGSIPDDLFQAVAEILAYVFGTRKKR
ncbi:MAG: flagellar biosynthesis protein FlhB [Desulfobulbaceae bacterium]|nr:flagellar biosynthesis protein FlhB [Desulfobulbaceae bacterium]